VSVIKLYHAKVRSDMLACLAISGEHRNQVVVLDLAIEYAYDLV
jgi:hypothetical protein